MFASFRTLWTTGVLCYFSFPAAAQSVAAGFLAGAPLNSPFQPRGSIGGQPFRVEGRPLAVGAALEVRLPRGLGAGCGVLYKPFRQTGGAVGGGTVSRTGGSWEFPIVARYRLLQNPRVRTRPYVEAGVSFNRLTGVLAPFRSLPAPPPDQPVRSAVRAGFTAGAGLEWKAGPVRVVPGFRFSRWRPIRNWPLDASFTADFLAGFFFF